MISNHILIEAEKQILSGGRAMFPRRLLVIHFTAGATAQSSINFWKEPKQKAKDIGAHLVIDRTGELYQCRAFNKTISHAGASRWDDPNDNNKHYNSCNEFSIGIEMANAGNDKKVIKIAKGLDGYVGTTMLKHRNGTEIEEWELYSPKMLEVCFDVSYQLVKEYNLDDISGHDCIAPERKNDPGPAFPMQELREHCGFSGLPKVHY